MAKPNLNIKLYSIIKNRIQRFTLINNLRTEKEKVFFAWAFNVIHAPKYSFLKLKKHLKKTQVLRIERRTAPDINLRLYSLFAGIMRHGKAARARNILSKVIILLTETCKERSGCTVLNGVLAYLEPAVGLLTYRRGRNFFTMPIPLWPSRKKFLAAQFLLKGARRRQKLYRFSFILALYYEILDLHHKNANSFSLKIFKKYRKMVRNVENQAWRSKKKKF